MDVWAGGAPPEASLPGVWTAAFSLSSRGFPSCCDPIPSSCKDTHIALAPPLKTALKFIYLTNHLSKGCPSEFSRTLSHWRRGFQHMSLGGTQLGL